jgi:glyoxylase-like metal-dependent hydrolase (beta-lactamase superfamily II)
MNAPVQLPPFEGWHLIGAFPDNQPDDVGSWLLVHDGEALLLEVPPGLRAEHARRALAATGAALRYVTASHNHGDHLDGLAWGALRRVFPEARMIHPSSVRGDRLLRLAGEPLWLVRAPKHSATDVVTVFRGVAMTGDIELGMLGSVNEEVPVRVKRASMRRLRDFEARVGYHVHSVVSAHLNDVRQGINWPDLFEC